MNFSCQLSAVSSQPGNQKRLCIDLEVDSTISTIASSDQKIL